MVGRFQVAVGMPAKGNGLRTMRARNLRRDFLQIMPALAARITGNDSGDGFDRNHHWCHADDTLGCLGDGGDDLVRP